MVHVPLRPRLIRGKPRFGVSMGFANLTGIRPQCGPDAALSVWVVEQQQDTEDTLHSIPLVPSSTSEPPT